MCLSEESEIYGLEPETMLHVLHDCSTAKFLWDSLRVIGFNSQFYMQERKEWFSRNLCHKAAHGPKDWTMSFGPCGKGKMGQNWALLEDDF